MTSRGGPNPVYGLRAVMLNDHDVLLGRGKGFCEYVGNKRFLDVVDEHKTEYNSTGSYKAKAIIAKEVLGEIEEKGGRFLERAVTANNGKPLRNVVREGAWFVVDRKIALEKCKQALREKRGVNPLNNTTMATTTKKLRKRKSKAPRRRHPKRDLNQARISLQDSVESRRVTQNSPFASMAGAAGLVETQDWQQMPYSGMGGLNREAFARENGDVAGVSLQQPSGLFERAVIDCHAASLQSPVHQSLVQQALEQEESRRVTSLLPPTRPNIHLSTVGDTRPSVSNDRSAVLRCLLSLQNKSNYERQTLQLVLEMMDSAELSPLRSYNQLMQQVGMRSHLAAAQQAREALDNVMAISALHHRITASSTVGNCPASNKYTTAGPVSEVTRPIAAAPPGATAGDAVLALTSLRNT